MRILHILSFLVGVQLMINGVFFSSSLLTAIGAAFICFFILIATKRSGHSANGNSNGNGTHHTDIGPKYHQIGSNGKETYFAPLALLSLIGGALAYLFLPMDNVYEKTAVTLAGTGLLYLLLAIFAHGWRVARKNVLSILFGGLFLLGVGAAIALRWTPLSQQTRLAFSHLGINQRMTTRTMNEVGETSGALSGPSTGMILTGISPATTGTNTVATTGSTATGNRDVPMTYGELIPYIVSKYGLNADKRADVTFTYIPKSDDRYKAFKAAYYDRFFSKSINPDKQVKCDNYVVFLGLAENRPVSYTADNVFTVFRNEAAKRGVLGGCKSGAYVKRTNLY